MLAVQRKKSTEEAGITDSAENGRIGQENRMKPIDILESVLWIR